MAKVAGNKLQVVTDGCSRDLNVRVRQDHAFSFEMSADAAENFCNGNVVRQNRDGWKNSLLDIYQVTFAVLRAVGTLVQFAYHNGTCKLLLTSYFHYPLNVGDSGTWA